MARREMGAGNTLATPSMGSGHAPGEDKHSVPRYLRQEVHHAVAKPKPVSLRPQSDDRVVSRVCRGGRMTDAPVVSGYVECFE